MMYNIVLRESQVLFVPLCISCTVFESALTSWICHGLSHMLLISLLKFYQVPAVDLEALSTPLLSLGVPPCQLSTYDEVPNLGLFFFLCSKPAGLLQSRLSNLSCSSNANSGVISPRIKLKFILMMPKDLYLE